MKKMCKTCPWRKQAIAGWLGSASPEEFIQCISKEIKLPCHSAIDYERDDWKEQIERGPHCAGALLANRKLCKLPRDPEHSRLVKEIEDDEDHISPREFLDKHNSASSKSWDL
jgi:hypothetical protein